MNELFICILLIILLYPSIIFTTNYFILDYFKKNGYNTILVFIIILSIFSFISGFLISLYASLKNCEKVNKTNLFLEGIRHIIYFLIAYFMIYYMSIVRQPFLDIFGNGKLGYSMGQSFIVVLNLITATIINYFKSIEKSCAPTEDQIDINLKKLDKFFNKKETKKIEKKIEIKD